MRFSLKAFLFTGSRRRVEGIHSEEVFRAVLAHERAVAERNAHFFALLAFKATTRHLRSNAIRILGRVLTDRLRTTDLAGWIDGRTVGVLLPYTRFKDATTVAKHICHKMAVQGVVFEYRIYLYPSDEHDETPGQKELPLAETLKGSDVQGVVGVEQGAVGGVQSMSPGASAGWEDAPQSLEDMCVPPLPLWKRVVDIVLSIVGIVLWSPVMLFIAVTIEMVSPGPVFFRQERVGFRGRRFVLMKFRSMRLNAETDSHKSHLAELARSNAAMTKLDKVDKRLIPFGRFFRASGLDELPQLFNILKGDMSLIGPRPCVPYEYETFRQWHKRRFDVMPGLTGLWQVSGKNKTTFTEMMRLDVAYTRRRSPLADLKILFRTIPTVIGQVKEMSDRKKGEACQKS
jgi:lipopolysaccharide/colanic/teichoic acid biosynthesis glycosyltransferase